MASVRKRNDKEKVSPIPKPTSTSTTPAKKARKASSANDVTEKVDPNLDFQAALDIATNKPTTLTKVTPPLKKKQKRTPPPPPTPKEVTSSNTSSSIVMKVVENVAIEVLAPDEHLSLTNEFPLKHWFPPHLPESWPGCILACYYHFISVCKGKRYMMSTIMMKVLCNYLLFEKMNSFQQERNLILYNDPYSYIRVCMTQIGLQVNELKSANAVQEKIRSTLKDESFQKVMKSNFGRLRTSVNFSLVQLLHFMCWYDSHFCHVMVINLPGYLKTNNAELSKELDNENPYNALFPEILVFDSLPKPKDKTAPFSALVIQYVINVFLSWMIQPFVKNQELTLLPVRVVTVVNQSKHGDSSSCGFLAFKSLTECVESQIEFPQFQAFLSRVPEDHNDEDFIYDNYRKKTLAIFERLQHIQLKLDKDRLGLRTTNLESWTTGNKCKKGITGENEIIVEYPQGFSISDYFLM